MQDVSCTTRSNRHGRDEAAAQGVLTCCEGVREGHVAAVGDECAGAALTKGTSAPENKKGHLLPSATAACTGR